MNVINEQQAAERLGLCQRTLQRMRENNSGPAYHRFGKRVGYTEKDLHEFMQKHRHQHPKDDGAQPDELVKNPEEI